MDNHPPDTNRVFLRDARAIRRVAHVPRWQGALIFSARAGSGERMYHSTVLEV